MENLHDLGKLQAEFIELTLFILTDDVTCDIKAFQNKDARLAEIEKEVGEEIARHWFSLAEDKAVETGYCSGKPYVKE